MRRIIAVSNRLPAIPARDAVRETYIPAGGLASAVVGALRRAPGSVWLGWNGRVVSSERRDELSTHPIDPITLVGLGLTQREVSDYYLGFCNQTLWPLFHCFQGKVTIDSAHETCYREVQTRFARALRSLLRSGDIVWVHDYHLLLLGQELRRLGWNGKIGFFLHVPFPPHDLWQILPDPRGCLEAMLDYDLVGFHVQSFLDNYVHCCKRQLGARLDSGTLIAGDQSQRTGVYPVGIDPASFLPPEVSSREKPRRGELACVVRGRRLILGVDRLDFTKGIPERIDAFRAFLHLAPEWKRKVSFIQVASPSRSGVPEYAALRARAESAVGRVNAEMAEHDWVPVRYLYRTYSRGQLAKFYREAAVGLVTPLRDGMNLVAKEFVAAQRPASPGVLVLSRTAGAAEELPEALIVNPYVPADVAAGIARALAMPLEERRQRHAALLARVLANTANEWSARFLADLEGATSADDPLLEVFAQIEKSGESDVR